MKIWRPVQRVPDATAPSKRLHHATVAAVSVVGLAAAVLSFRHQASLAAGSGEVEWSSKLVPIITDGLLVAGTIALLDASRRARSKRWPRATVILGVFMTLWANIVHGLAWGWHGVIEAAWSPVAVILAVEVLAAMAHSRTAAPAGEPVPAEEPSGPAAPIYKATAREQIAEPAPILEPASEPVPAPAVTAAPDNKATRSRRQSPPSEAVASLLDNPGAEVTEAIAGGAAADQIAAQFPGINLYRAKQLVKLHRAASNGHDLGEAG